MVVKIDSLYLNDEKCYLFGTAKRLINHVKFYVIEIDENVN